MLDHVHQVFTVLKAQRRLCRVLQTVSEAPQEVPTYRTAYCAHLSIGVNLEMQSFICVLLVITVMVYLAAALMERQDPGHVLCTPIELPLAQAARVTACPVLLVLTVIAQGLQTTPIILAHLVIGAVGLDPLFSAHQAPRGPFLELLHLANVSPVQGEPSVQILGLQESPMWRGYPAGPLIIVPWVQSQRGCAELAHTVDLRLLNLKSVLKVTFVQRDPIPTTPPNNSVHFPTTAQPTALP